ncbi:MAG TPA: 16S rRNA (adenine(1518)-N(6)/adenine(1519)-N(6))-dimethyltransferase RsmA [Chthoniobacterales bacterium]
MKSLGQNFLHDPNLARWIVDQIEPSVGDYIVEIGPGLGALTGHLLNAGARVLAIEKDGRLADYLRRRFKDEALEVRHGDALNFDVLTLFGQRDAKLIGNLPYYISSQLLMKFLEFPSPISLSVLMLQKEMADRISASPGTKAYGALTVVLQRRYQVELLRKVPTAVFTPRPEVDSAVVRVWPKSSAELAECDDELFVSLVRRGFSQRRKQLGKLLQDWIQDWPAAAAQLGLKVTARAETLALPDWIALTNYVRPIEVIEGSKETDESFSVVDDSDVVMGAAPRHKVHGDNLRHRAVHILVFNAVGEVFLQKRSRRKDRHPCLWDSSAAGHVMAGEEYDAAAHRELKEELGIEVALERITKLPASERTGQEFIWLYRARHNGEMSLNRDEIEAGRYFQPAIVTGWIAARPGDFAPGFNECWKSYTKRCP